MNGEVYYEIADVCAVEAFKAPNATADQDFSDLLERTADLTLAFGDAVELFIKAYLEKEGWRGELVSEAHYNRPHDRPSSPR